ncbi:MAG: M28 family peptidase [Candidatus Lokiarchaeota archaeon]|nr:M28 family peptidase [Candidatus Lokiarchaeota archaeon]
MAGTEGEKKAVKLAYEAFEEIGFKKDQIEKQPFDFSDFYSTTLMKFLLTLNLVLVLNLLLFSYIHGAITMVLVIFVTIVVYLIVKGINHPEIPGFWGEFFGETLNSTNVFTKVPAIKISEKDAGNIVISAHLDSKSQSMNTFWRVIFYKITFYSGIMLIGVYIVYFIILLGNLDVSFYFTIYGGWISIILISFSNICLLFLNTHNKSPGALDNASGMAIVFELSSYFIENPLNYFNIWFCQFSAEELGTMGARIFVDEYENQFIKGKVFQINFDMVSCKEHKNNQIEYIQSYGIGMRKIYSPILNKYILLAAKEKDIKVKNLHASTGAHSDTVPFRLRKYDTVDITNEAASLYTHTVKDTPDKVDPKILFNACILFKATMKLIDKNYKNKCENQ